MNGFVHSFESLGTLDGPGVRCVVFLQGCPLRCIYCHNPDTWDRTKGISFSAEEVVRRVSRYRPYFGETGGITISGGEPLLQAEFVTDIFRLCRESGIHTVLDTSGHGADLSSLIPLLKETDLVLLDIKMTTEQDYAEKIGGSLQKTMDFLSLLERQKMPVWIRQVVVPGITDSRENLIRLASLLNGKKCVQKVEFLPFRKLCQEKYDRMGLPFPLDRVPETIDAFCKEYANRFYELLSANQKSG